MTSMEKTYSPEQLEERLYAYWEERGLFAPSGRGAPYCIMIPPPNVTGTLHMGHAFQDTIMDALTRRQRMAGRDTLWQPGTDHAGIATQMVVERLLNAEGTSRVEIGREAFVERVWAWKEESGNTIGRQLRRLGASVDWSRERFTMDPGLSRAVTEVFVALHEKGLIYRGKRLVNWDPVLHTAISDLEVVSEEEAGSLWHLRYPLAGGDGHLVVATTRPETMLGDTAVAVHPEDERYRHLVGKTVRLPLAGREIPIIADEYVDPEFGSGCVKITPAHDFNDYEVGQRHGLPMISLFDADARIRVDLADVLVRGPQAGAAREALGADWDRWEGSALVPDAYRGLDRFEARKRVVADLEAAGLMDRIEEYRLKVPRGDRSGAVVEPFLTDQWFVKAGELAGPAIAAVEDGRIRFVPENWAKTYFEWMRNIQDWCISRQLWWGHRIPAWYDEAGNVFVARDEESARAQARQRHGGEVDLRQDGDVLDTWFSSALWPFSTLGWPDETPELGRYYPTSVLVTGFDIIFFWVARMVMMGLEFMGEVPFRDVYIHGLIRDQEGQKMSKSKGNVLDPLDLIDGVDLETLVAKRTSGLMQPQMRARIEKITRQEFPDGIPAFGTDALRFTFAALATTGRDIRFDLGRVEGYRNFCNKLWNAARYVLMNTEDRDCGPGGEMAPGLPERWIRSRLARTIEAVDEAFGQYRLDLAAQALYEFTWHEYCDWYLELSKPVLTGTGRSEPERRATRRTLVEVLETLLRLLHPLMPFITESIWQKAAPVAGIEGSSIMIQPWPTTSDLAVDETAEREIGLLQSAAVGIRGIRAESTISPGKPLSPTFRGLSPGERRVLEDNRALLASIARLSSFDFVPAEEEVEASATALVGSGTVHVRLAGLIDARGEIERLERQREKIDADLGKSESKLANERFVANAPADVVEKERQRAQEAREAMDRLDRQLATLRGLV